MLLCGNCNSMDFEEFGSWREMKFSCCRNSEHLHLQKMALEALYKDSKHPSHGGIEEFAKLNNLDGATTNSKEIRYYLS